MDFLGAYSPDNLSFIMEGFGVTLRVAFLSILFSFILGTIIGVVRYAKLPVLSPVLALFVEIIRNLPLLLIIFFTKFALPQVGIKLSIEWAAIMALTVFEGAMIAEIVRGGLNSIEKGQIEASRSSGMTYTQTLWNILLPQALRRMSPPMVSQFISLLKDTSLAIVISLPELMHHVQIVGGQQFSFVVPLLLLAALLYFTVNYILSIIARRLEARRV
ncbi:amino acid ABC transporter permease [Paenibacillus turpanensis]|uniref:amino acid ABC transporter permease n=1 Tax=Paenibacillus turpanensis TaxID=2689078 RepID=UPI00140AE5D9|nr:amino acid ABC transporter permease [Paenibacillus turpanensis]